MDQLDLMRPLTVKLENCMAVSTKKPWTHLTKYELDGLAVIINWLEGLAPNKKRVPADIPEPDALLRDARVSRLVRQCHVMVSWQALNHALL